jgi:nucleotide-binding universal stress UspA family protein
MNILTSKGEIYMTTNYKSILVAVDGSKEAEYALQKAIGIVKRNEGSTLNIVNILDSRLETLSGIALENVQKESDQLLVEYKVKAEAAGVANVKTLSQFGSPKVVIAKDVAEAVKADLILCGATGLNAVERFIVGSVSGAIVRSAKCDVLVVRTPEE